MGRKARLKRLRRSSDAADLPEEKRPRKGRLWRTGLLLLACVALGTWRLFPRRLPDLGPYGTWRLVREAAAGGPLLYLIPMEHYYAGQTATGPEKDALQEASLAPIQRDIYRILECLHRRAGIELVFGEGFEGELGVDRLKFGFTEEDYRKHRRGAEEDGFLDGFFRDNPKETGYTAYEFFHPEILTWGDDGKELHRPLERLNEQMFDYFSGKGEIRMPIHEFMEWSRGEQARLNHLRSVRTLESALAECEDLHKARRIRKRAVAIVMGSAHIPEIIEEATVKHPGVGIVEVKPAALPSR